MSLGASETNLIEILTIKTIVHQKEYQVVLTMNQ